MDRRDYERNKVKSQEDMRIMRIKNHYYAEFIDYSKLLVPLPYSTVVFDNVVYPYINKGFHNELGVGFYCLVVALIQYVLWKMSPIAPFLFQLYIL